MSILGKVLAILCVVAAAAFLYLATADWQERQTWSYAVYRQDLALNGLPVDEEQKNADGVREVDKLSDDTVRQIFQPVGGAGEKTQIAEVRRLQQNLRGELDGLPDENQKRVWMMNRLVPLARTLGEREALEDQIRKGPIQDLLGPNGPFELAFQEVLRPKPGVGWDPEDRRLAIAHLLFNLADVFNKDAGEYQRQYQRVLVVIGLKAFAVEGDRQAMALRDMTTGLAVAMERDRGAFAENYRHALRDLESLAANVDARKAKLAEYADLAKKNQDLRAERQKDVDDLKKRLEAARQATAATFARLSDEQKRLFQEQERVKKLAEGNEAKEREIRKLEKVEIANR